MAFIVDTTLFQAEGALLNWQVIARRLGMIEQTTLAANVMPSVLQLRWMIKRELGLPTEPFIVWRRHKKLSVPKKITPEVIRSSLFGLSTIVDLQGTYSHITLTLSGSAGLVYAFVGSPWLNSVVAFAPVAAGASVTVTLTAPAMEGLILSNGISITNVAGLRADDLTAASGWTPFEIVGLPVKKDDWAGQGIGKHGTEQGMTTALTDAITAAGQRLERGAPRVGWASFIEAGLPAPTWTPPSHAGFLAEVQQELLKDLQSIASLPPATHAATNVTKQITPPENSSGQKMTGNPNPAQVSPLSMTYMAAGTDCYGALGLGFGTAYPIVRDDRNGSALDYDYMVTARYEGGPLGNGAPVEYAAVVPSPSPALATPAPASMLPQMLGNLRPKSRDDSWLGSVRVSWDRPVPIPLFRPRSFAFARAGIAPASPATLLMNKRRDGTPLPIAINYVVRPEDPEPNRVSAVEREITIPNNPGTRTLRYAVAQQDIYGQYSKWVATSTTLTQPDPDAVRIVSAEFAYTSVPTPPQSKCPAKLVLEFLWDWRIRSPLQISFRGRLYPAAYHGAPPPDTSIPGGLHTKLGGALTTTFTLNFDITTPSGAPTCAWPGYSAGVDCIALNAAGDQQVAFGSAQGTEARRYRVTIPGFEIDFASSGHVGLALWAQGQESIAPQRVGAWSAEPNLIATSDPRPPLIVPDIVSLASLPDAAGEAHAVLKWSGSPGADGYFIYESTEAKLLTAVGDPEPDPSKTLSQRLTRLREIFDANPAARRSDFTRRNARLIKGTSSDVTLPRGSTSIHLYIVLGVSAGQVEAQWPTASTSLYAFAVPRVPKPAAPMIEVTSTLDQTVTPAVFRSQVRIATRKGPRVRRIDLHRVRVDDAAKELDTMGPPVLTLDTSTPGWQVATTSDALGTHIVTASGIDTPNGSWKRVWYRAAAWSDADLLRGTLPARSPASGTAWVVIPPSMPPNLSPLVLDWPGSAPGDVLVSFTSSAPLRKTALGAHTLAVRAKRVGSASGDTPLIQFDAPLTAVPTAQPATGSGVWHDGTGTPTQYRALLRRADINDAVEISVRMTDPLGRSSESLARIEAGHILPDPVISEPALITVLAPAGRQLNWKSTTPLLAGAYILRVTVSRPPRRVGMLFINQPPISLQLALSDVPLDEPGPVPPGADPLRLRRFPDTGPEFRYYAFVRVPFTQIAIRLTSPDGRVAQHVQLPG